jgi:hypothetical protein
MIFLTVGKSLLYTHIFSWLRASSLYILFTYPHLIDHFYHIVRALTSFAPFFNVEPINGGKLS